MAKQNWKAAGGRRTAFRIRPTRWTEASRNRVQYVTQLVVTALALLLVVVLLVAAFQWLNPLPAPKLILLTAGYASEPLPANSSAAADARLLQGLTRVFDPSDADSGSAGRERFRALIRGIAEHKPNRQFLAPWKATTSVIYVNAIGVGLPAADDTEPAETLEAWLVPSDFQPVVDIRSRLVPLSELLTAVVQCRAEQKLLVLDCQRPPVQGLLGPASARFVDAARQELRRLPEPDTAGLYVLLSCSPEEFAWPEHPESTSVFGRRFAQGLAGAADGNADERVTLSELADYLAQQVGDWATGQCLARQTPILVDFNRPADFILSAAGDSRQVGPVPHLEAGSFTRPNVAAQLERALARHFDLAQRVSPACEWTPAQWTTLQDRLLLAERLYVAGDVAAAGVTLERLDADATALFETHRTLRQIVTESSQGAGRLLDRCCASGWGELPAAVPDPTAPIVVQALAGTISLTEADEQLAEIAAASAQPLPIPAQFLRIVAARSNAVPALAPADAMELVAQRQQSEDRFQPRHSLAARWLRAEMSLADTTRLNQEDQRLLAGWQPLRVGTPGSGSQGATADVDATRTIARACVLREVLLADLPVWISYLDASQPYLSGWRQPEEPAGEAPDGKPTAIPGMEFPRTAARAVLSLLGDLEQLQRTLPIDPAALGNDERTGHLQRIAAATADIELQLDRLQQQLVRYATIVSQERLAPSTGDTWRRIDALLRLPFPMTEPGARAADAARLRMQLLTRAAAVTTPAAPSEDPGGDARQAHLRDIQELYRRLYLLPFDGLPPDEVPAGDREFVSGELQGRLVELAHGAGSADMAAAYRSDTAFRLLRGGLGQDVAVASPAIRLLVYGLVDSIHAQIERVLRDFYGGGDGESPYFQRQALDLLRGAERLGNVDEFLARVAPPGAAAAPPVAARESAAAAGLQPAIAAQHAARKLAVAQAGELFGTTQLTAVPPEIEFRASSTARLKLGLSTTATLPPGIAGAHMDTAIPETADSLPDAGASFRLPRPGDEGSAADALAASAYFRGHTLISKLPIRVVSEAGAPALTYLHQNAGAGRIRIRSDRVDQEALNLLFVLDCSGSMSLPDELGESRMGSLRSVLAEFAAALTEPDVRVGVRLFGHTERDVTAPGAHTDTRLIEPIRAFGRSRLQNDVLPQLRPVGHSPIFNALIAARQDFEGITDGRREIVLISDGADNWALAGQKPGLNELMTEYRGSGIRINAIGYKVDRAADFIQLQSIATAGEFEGRSVSVTNARDLLWELAGLAGLPGCRVQSAGRVVFEQRQLDLDSRPLEFPAGQYDVEVLGAGGETLARTSVRLLPGEEHVLAFEAGALGYADDPRSAARAVAAGNERQPDLLVLDAQPGDGELTLEFGLLGKPDAPVDLVPASAQIVAVTPGGRGPTWRFRQWMPNVTGRHFPAWRVTLGDWPADATALDVRVHWNDLPDRSIPVTLDWNTQFSERQVVDNVVLTRRERVPVDIDGASHTAVALTFVLSERGPGIERWGLSVPGTALLARHAYDADLGIFATRIVVADGAPLNEVFLVHAPDAPADRTLSVTIPLAESRINR